MKKSKKTRTLLSVYVVMFTMGMFVLNAVVNSKILIFIEPHNLYSPYTVEITCRSTERNKILNIIDKVINKKYKDINIMKHCSSEKYDIKGVYYSQVPNGILEEESPFFKIDSDKSNEAIVGRGLKDKISIRGDRRYITIYEKEFEVVGYLNSKKTYLDKQIFVPIKSLLEITDSSGTYTIDGSDKKDIKEVANYFDSSELPISVLYPDAIKHSIASAFFSRSNQIVYIYIIWGIFLIMYVQRGVSDWLYLNRYDYFVYKDIGYREKQITMEYFCRYIKPAISAILIGTFVSLLILQIVSKNIIMISEILINLFIIVFLNIVVFMITFLGRIKKQRRSG
ncbi:hypothetical protein M2145_002899 [Lachnospiraceae bacterium PF1-21]|uniref:MacB-like periplasmic core domain-containing protein n=1 Tax=Ohessyouella blattaphilus TaxID=2949333 RepID=A0ABT1EQG8_9FIRM|nr:hypothetical protein [Ohessyouella blattaphilus]MCP1111512.1 hypothetical protein [Ohessyouella blattaphilus]MCR8564906.1 hypothetical protein [Ohessyouella blattaphilus]